MPYLSLDRCLLLEVPFRQIQKFERKIFHARPDLPDPVPEVHCKKWLAGMAANRPNAVATSACAMPGPTGLQAGGTRETQAPESASMMPHTVPNRPTNGLTEAMVASQFILRSRREISSLMPSCSVRSSADLVGDLVARGHLPADLAIAEIEDAHQGRGAELLARGGHGVQARGFAKRAQKLAVGESARRATMNHLEKIMVQESSDAKASTPSTAIGTGSSCGFAEIPENLHPAKARLRVALAIPAFIVDDGRAENKR